jgi:hypothetical protein
MKKLLLLFSLVLLQSISFSYFGAKLSADAIDQQSSGPEITGVTPNSALSQGGEIVVVEGRNFTTDIQVVLGDGLAMDLKVLSETKLQFRVPRQNAIGFRNLTVRTGDGVAQHEFQIIPRPLRELANGAITTIGGGIRSLGDSRPATDTRRQECPKCQTRSSNSHNRG